MPIELAVWRLGEQAERVVFSSMDSESRLEDLLADDLSVISPDLMLLGRQVATAFGKFIDLLAIDSEGNLSVIELKRNRTPREVVAQVLDYASWVQSLSYEQVTDIYEEKHPGQKFETGFAETFGGNPPEQVNQSHELVIVASDLDPSTERIIGYLGSNYGVPVNAVFFRHFVDDGNEYLTRTWLIDPQEAEAKASRSTSRKGGEPWNGRDFYISLGEGDHRNWEDCRRYGFVSGGQGKWYSQTLKLLFPGARVFVNLVGKGFVGTGTVVGERTAAKDFVVDVDGTPTPLFDAPLSARNMAENADDPELCEYVVPVEWTKTLDREEAYWEKGLFAVQHTACRLRNQFTIERLVQHFGLEDE